MKNIHVLSVNDLRVSVPCLVPSKRVSVLTRLTSRSSRGTKMQHLGLGGVRDRIEIDNLLVRLGFGRDHFDAVKEEGRLVPVPGIMDSLVRKTVSVPHEDPRNDLDLVNFYVPIHRLESFLARLQKVPGVQMVQAPPVVPKKKREKRIAERMEVRMAG